MASVSVTCSSAVDEGVKKWTLSILANDVLRGLFHFRLDITAPSDLSSNRPEMSVRLIGAYTGIYGFVSGISLGPQGLRGTWIERARNQTARRVVTFSTSRQWFEDPLEAPARIHTSQASSDEEETPDTIGLYNPTQGFSERTIDGQTVYEVRSYDLRGNGLLLHSNFCSNTPLEDLMHIAVSEVTGHIVLGTRAGQLRVI